MHNIYTGKRTNYGKWSLIKTQGHPCAEDCGGSGGWEDLKDAFKKESDPEGRKNWYKKFCYNGDPEGLDPYKWSILDVNDELAEIEGQRKSLGE